MNRSKKAKSKLPNSAKVPQANRGSSQPRVIWPPESPASQQLAPYQRANLAYRLTFGDIGIPYPYDEDDSYELCELAVYRSLATLHEVPNTNPLTNKFPSTAALISWFNYRYPVKPS